MLVLKQLFTFFKGHCSIQQHVMIQKKFKNYRHIFYYQLKVTNQNYLKAGKGVLSKDSTDLLDLYSTLLPGESL
jgi:hypothetical protein